MARQRRSGRGPDYDWFNIGDQATSVDIGIVGATYGVTALTLSTAVTLMRLRGTVGVTLDSAGVDEKLMILFGIAIVTTDNFAAGAASELFTNSVDESSWIWQGSLFLSSGAEAAIVPDLLSGSVPIDSKAMRKVKANETVVFVHETPTELAQDQGGTYDLTYFIHMLFAS